MANLGEELWRHFEEGKTAAIRLVRIQYIGQCASKSRCNWRATIAIECRDSIGHPIWHRDFCQPHADPIIAKAKALRERDL